MDLESVKPERFICDCSGIGRFFIRLRRWGLRRKFRWTEIRFYCADCVGGLSPTMLKMVRPVNETEA
jgi:hypothetical protein